MTKIANAILRIARPSDDLQRVSDMYCRGLGFERLGEFDDHQGFDGVILGHPHHGYHLEFTSHRGVTVGKAPTQDNLLVFYLPDAQEWETVCEQIQEAGFLLVASYNPYWDINGKTFEDVDGYRVVLQRASWQR
jgi:hypothetical protein